MKGRPLSPTTVSRIVTGLIVGVPLLLRLLAGIPVFLAILIIIFTYDERPEKAAQRVATG
jgi:hypothetical protein